MVVDGKGAACAAAVAQPTTGLASRRPRRTPPPPAVRPQDVSPPHAGAASPSGGVSNAVVDSFREASCEGWSAPESSFAGVFDESAGGACMSSGYFDRAGLSRTAVATHAAHACGPPSGQP